MHCVVFFCYFKNTCSEKFNVISKLEGPAKKKLKIEQIDMDVDHEAHFENEYSRLLATLGKDALKKLQSSRVLLCGLGGLGLEIAKNILLMGIAHLTIHDPVTTTVGDLSSQFYLTESSIGKNRAEEALPRLKELNERVQIVINNNPITEDTLKDFTVVVLTDTHPRDEMVKINQFCHARNIAFISGAVWGLFGWTFVDCGEEYISLDPTGELPKDAFIENITQSTEGLITCVDSKRHDLEDGDIIKIEEVQGMTELNGTEWKVKVVSPYVLSIGDTSNFSPYIKGGHVEQVKTPKTIKFKPLSEYLGKPGCFEDILTVDDSKMMRYDCYHYYTEAMLDFHQANGRFPKPGSRVDAKNVLSITQKLWSQANENKEPFPAAENDAWIEKLALGASAVISPMATIFGGIIAQEVLKATSSKYTPIKQWLFFETLECLPKVELSEEDCAPRNTRYDAQIAVFGNKMNETILNLRYFLVGAGAIGCEVAKCWAMMGLGSGPQGRIDVTDMDTIEISNLNRQFLYRNEDVNNPKSQTAAKAVKKMNPNTNIHASLTRVGPETENTFDVDFFENLSGICNALDNQDARLYMDSKAVFHRKPMFDSGTQGSKGNVQVVIPHLTESYAASNDPPTPETALCLLHSFPHNISHCLQWARELLFEGYFIKEPEVTNNYIQDENFLGTLPGTLKVPTLDILDHTINQRPKSFDDCIAWARCLFEDRFVVKIQQLLYTFPLDYTDQHGSPFWSGAKRPPKPIQFDPNNEIHMNFIVAATFLKAYTSGLIDSEFKPRDLKAQIEHMKSYTSGTAVEIPAFVPKKLNVVTDEKVTKEVVEYTDEDDIRSKQTLEKLPPREELSKYKMNVVSFEKDNDSNFHIDFITAASNLRALNYGIPTASRLQSKIIAGRIIPAIVTTTACVVGFVQLELYKFHAGEIKDLSLGDFRNTFINLALPLFRQVEPIKPKKLTYVGKEFDQWTRIDIRKPDCTLKELIAIFEKEHNVSIDMLGVGSALIFASWMMSKAAVRLPKKITDVIEEVTQKKIDPSVHYIMLDPTASDENGNDIENLPLVCLWLK